MEAAAAVKLQIRRHEILAGIMSGFNMFQWVFKPDIGAQYRYDIDIYIYMIYIYDVYDIYDIYI